MTTETLIVAGVIVLLVVLTFIGETYSEEDMEKLIQEFVRFNIKPDNIIGKTVIFKCQSISAYA